jgi:hypothetical protein
MKKMLTMSLASAILCFTTNAQKFNWGSHVQTNGSTRTIDVKGDGSGAYYSLVSYNDSSFINGQGFSSYDASQLNSKFRNANLIIRYQKDGTVDWVRNVWSSVPQSTITEFGTNLTHLDVDSLGSVYIQGRSRGTTYLDTMSISDGIVAGDVSNPKFFSFIAKLDSMGKAQWVRKFNSGYNGTAAETMEMALSPDGAELYSFAHDDTMQVGGLNDPLGGNFFLKFNTSSGSLIGSITYNNSGLPLSSYSLNMEAADSNIYFSFRLVGSNINTNIVEFKRFSPSWSVQSISGKLTDLKVEKDTLYLSGLSIDNKIFVSKYDYASNTTVWTTNTNQENNYQVLDLQSLAAVDVNKLGETLLFARVISPNLNFDGVALNAAPYESLFIAKLDDSGTLVWYNKVDSIYNPIVSGVSLEGDFALVGGSFNSLSSNRSQAIFDSLVLLPRLNLSSGYDSYLVSVALKPNTQAFIDLPDTVTVCQGDSLVLEGKVIGGTGAYTYRWTNGKFTINDTTSRVPTTFPYQDTTYYFSVTDGFTESIDSIRIQVSNSFLLTAFFYPKDSALGYAMVPGFGPFDADSIFWDFGDGNFSNDYWPYHTYAQKGVYIVTLYIENFCGSSTFTDTIDATCPGTDASFNFSYGVQPGEAIFSDQSISPTNIVLWNWDFGDGNSSSAQNPIHTYTTNGNFKVCLSMTDSCGTDTTCQEIIINTIGLVDYYLSNTKLYPNPSSDLAYVELPLKGKWEVEVLDMKGILIQRKKVIGDNLEIATNDWQVGYYIVKIKGADLSYTLNLSKVN